MVVASAALARDQSQASKSASSGLAPALVQALFDEVARIAQDGSSILMVEQNAKQALGIVDRGYVLENGRVTLHKRDVTLRELLDRAEAARSAPDGRPAIAIRRDRSREGVSLHTDPDRLTQVFVNLIANAQKYCTAPAPELRIEVRTGSDIVHVDFIDNGPGIPGPSQGIIFEKFSRLSESNAAGGAGLGLAICREVMTRLGGRIGYLPGQGGAAFRVELPLARRTAA